MAENLNVGTMIDGADDPIEDSNIEKYCYDNFESKGILPGAVTIAELISKIKTPSCKWIKKQGITNYSWQGGYGVFSVSSSKVKVVERYIENQS